MSQLLNNYCRKLHTILYWQYLLRKNNVSFVFLQILPPLLCFLVYNIVLTSNAVEPNFVNATTYKKELTVDELFDKLPYIDTKIYYAPESNYTKTLINKVRRHLRLTVDDTKGFENEFELLNSVKKIAAEDDQIILGLIFNGDRATITLGLLDYAVRIRNKGVKWHLNDLYDSSNDYEKLSGSYEYVENGFLPIQSAAGMAYAEVLSVSLPRMVFQEFGYPPHWKNPFLPLLNSIFLPMATIMSLLALFPGYLIIVTEKRRSQMPHLMKIMGGISNEWLNVGWFLESILFNLIIATAITCLLTQNIFAKYAIITQCDFKLLLLFFFLFATVSIASSFFFATSGLFPQKCVFDVAIYYWLISFAIPSYVVHYLKVDGIVIYLLMLLFPTVTITNGFDIISRYEVKGITLSWNNINQVASGSDNGITFDMILYAFISQLMLFAILPCLLKSITNFAASLIFCPNVEQLQEIRVIGEDISIELGNLLGPVALDIRNTSKYLHGSLVLDNISLKLYQNKLTVLIGDNGAGKSTLFSLLTGVTKCDGGEIKFDNRSTSASNGWRLLINKIGICYQNNYLSKSFTVSEHLKVFAMMTKSKSNKSVDDRVDFILNRLDLQEKRFCRLHQLSSSTSRMVCLAIAMIVEPELLFLDEITTGMDFRSRKLVYRILNELKTETTILLSTHHVKELGPECDFVALMNEGRIERFESFQRYTSTVHDVEDSGSYSTNCPTNSERNKAGTDIKSTANTGQNNNLQRYVKLGKMISVIFHLRLDFLKAHWLLYLLHCSILLIGISLTLYFTKSFDPIIEETHLKLSMDTYKSGIALYQGPENVAYQYRRVINKSNFAKMRHVRNISHELTHGEFHDLEHYRKNLIIGLEYDEKLDRAKILYSPVAHHGAPVALNAALNAFLLPKGAELITSNKPLENMISHVPNVTKLQIYNSVIWCLFLVTAFHIFLLVQIRYHQFAFASKLKKMQLMAGINSTTYWIFHLLIDSLLNFVMVLMIAIVLFIVGRCLKDTFYGELIAIGKLAQCFLLYGMVGSLLAYIFSNNESKSLTFCRFLVYNVLIGSLWTGIHLIVESVNDDYMQYFSFASIPLHPSAAVTYYIVDVVKKNIWNFNWDRSSEAQRLTICEIKYNPCCKKTVNEIYDYDEGACEKYMYYDEKLFSLCLLMLIYTIVLLLWLLVKDSFTIKRRFLEGLTKVINKIHCKSMDCELASQHTDVELPTPERELEDGFHVRDLELNYKSKLGIENVSFDIPKGECLGLIGSNGAGKTTIFKILCGTILPKRGSATITLNTSNEPILFDLNMSDFYRQIGYCPQVTTVKGSLNAKTILSSIAKLRGSESVDEDVNQLISDIGLSKQANKPIDHYSGGMKRKLMLAVALIGNPPFLMLDEPTAGIDPVSCERIANLLRKYKNNGGTILLTSSDSNLTRSLCEKVAVM